MSGITPELREGEPKIVFEILIHLKEKTKADFLGDLVGYLKPENKYVQALGKRVDTKGVRLNLSGGRSLKTLGMLSNSRGLSLIDVRWRDDIESKREGGMDKGVAVLLQFGSDSSKISEEMKDKMSKLVDKIFNDYLWSVDNHEDGNKIGLYGPIEIVTKKDGSRASDDMERQFFPSSVKVIMGASGMKYNWGGTELIMPY